jgi:hypothetical protein
VGQNAQKYHQLLSSDHEQSEVLSISIQAPLFIGQIEYFFKQNDQRNELYKVLQTKKISAKLTFFVVEY